MRTRLVSPLLIAALACAGSVFGSRAALAASASTSTTCSSPMASPLLAAWGDRRLYFPVVGGSVENAADWTIGSGASIVRENEPWSVLGSGRYSLRLNPGSGASAKKTCVPFVDDLRMFVKSPGTRTSVLHVHLETVGSVNSGSSDYGRHHAVRDYYLSGGSGWTLTPGLEIPGRTGPGRNPVPDGLRQRDRCRRVMAGRRHPDGSVEIQLGRAGEFCDGDHGQ